MTESPTASDSKNTGTNTMRGEQTGDLLLDLGLPDNSTSLQNKAQQDMQPDDDTATKRRSSRKSKSRQQEPIKQQDEVVRTNTGESSETDEIREPGGPSFEQSIQQLSHIVEQLESGDLPLEQSVKLFEHGMGIVKRCNRQLKNAAQTVQKLIAVDDEGNAHTEPFDT